MNLIKNIALIFFCVIGFAFTPHERIFPETLDWDTHFRATPDVNSNYAAVTSTIWQYGYTSKVKGNHLQIDFNFLGGVDANKSWVKREKIRDKNVSRTLLNHEQGHVYINFLLLKNGEIILKNQDYTIQNYQRLVNKTAKEISKFYNDMQQRYDEETKHGSNLEAQQGWDAFFEQELRKF